MKNNKKLPNILRNLLMYAKIAEIITDENRILLMRTEYFLFVHHTTSFLAKLSTWCFEHSGYISCSLLLNLSDTDESWQERNMCLWIYTLCIHSLTLENIDENRLFFVCSPHHNHFGRARRLVL